MLPDKSSITIIMIGMIFPFAVWFVVSFVWAYFEVIEDEKRKEAKQKEKKESKKRKKKSNNIISDDYKGE